MTLRLAVLLVFLSLACAPWLQAQDDSTGAYFSPEQLDNLLAPIALYPDPLLAQVLTAATFPDQIDEAARFVRANSDPNYIDSQPWDVSVQAVAHYPEVLYKMANDLDWTTALGQAFVDQSSDVMAAVQRLRVEARSAGNLVTTPQWEVVDSGGDIQIWPAQPQYIYVPVYDPSIVYFGHGSVYGNAISFGVRFAIGAWLNRDFDWRGHRVYYTGWEHGGGWMARSRPFIQVSNVYVNNNYRNVVVNRNVVNRNVNYGGLNRYQSVHQQVNYGNVRAGRTVVNNQTVVNNVNVNRTTVNNKIIDRNIDVRDTRINDYRGRGPEPQPNPPQPARPQTYQPEPARPQVFQPTHQAPAPQVQRQEHGAFSGNTGGFDEHAASQRGQASRTQQYQPQVTARPSNPPPSGGRGGATVEDRGKRR
jgi:hypothetical protein